MNTKILSNLSKLDTALSNAYHEQISSVLKSQEKGNHPEQSLNIYSAFIFLTQKQGYSAIPILNKSELLKQHLCQLIGFVYDKSPLKPKSNYAVANLLKKAFKVLANEKQLELMEIKLGVENVSDDAERCIEEFKKLSIESEKMNYLCGWQITSKDGKKIDVNLDSLYCKFGPIFINTIHTALKDYGLTQKATSLTTYVRELYKVLNGFALLGGDTVEELENKLSTKNVHYFFRGIMEVQFASSKIQGHDEDTFYKRWAKAIAVYTHCFIHTKIFDAPLKPFLTPKWKKPVNDDIAFSTGGKPTSKEVKRWFGGIDFHITDEDTIVTIQRRLEKDVNHIQHVCDIKFNELKKRHSRNIQFINNGKVRSIESTVEWQKSPPMGAKHLENTIATFYEYGIGAQFNNYRFFLGFNKDARTLNTELNLPSRSTLNVLICLLILAHPKITPSWLQEWELFDKKGAQVGFKQVGDQWIAISVKNRRGAALAQQEMVLNSKTKEVVEFLIEHTRMAREHLKSLGDPKWRKMLIAATATDARVYTDLNSSLQDKNEFHDWLSDISLLPKESELTQPGLDLISEIVSPRSIRRHRALQIYLETRSIRAVADALGHKLMDLRLIASYLPKPLIDFFNDRWIRQFQNAIILEAMKDSKYRFDASDVSEKHIKEFLDNHGISDIPEYFDDGFTAHEHFDKESHDSFDGATFNITTALLQLLFAIKDIVENAESKTVFKDIAYLWYKASVYITSALKTDRYGEEDDLMAMLNDAHNNPLETHKIRGALTC